MTPKQKMMVQLSFTKISPHTDEVAARFYERLFEVDPSTRELFAETDMKAQGRKLFQVLGLVVRNLDHAELIGSEVEELGRRHFGYGVAEHHYESFGDCLLWAIEQTLGEDFGAEEKKGWRQTYDLMATVMQRAAAETPD